MINFKKLQPVLLSLLFMSGSAAVLGWMWISVNSFGENLYENMQAIANEQVFDTQYAELLAMVEETQFERETLEKFILHDDNDTIALLSKIDEIASHQGVELATRDLKVVEKEGSFNDLSVGFQITGGEKAVMKLIRMFEALPYHGHVTNLSLQRMRDDLTGEVTLDATLSLLLSVKKYD